VPFQNQKRNKTGANKTRKVRITQHSGAFLQPLLQWNSSVTYLYINIEYQSPCKWQILSHKLICYFQNVIVPPGRFPTCQEFFKINHGGPKSVPTLL